jgi:predicted ester cyclase
MTRREMVGLGLGFSVLAGAGRARSIVAAQSRQNEGQENLERNKALVGRWIEEGFNRQDLKVVDVVFVEDFTVNGSPLGRAGLKQSMAGRFTAFPDLQVSVVEIIAEGDKVGVWYTVSGTQRGEFEGIQPTGKRVNWFGSDFLRVEGGRIVAGWFVDDSLGLLRQLGETYVPSINPGA